MLKQDTAEPYRARTAGRWHPVILFAGLGLVSGALSMALTDIAAGTDFWKSPLVGVAFGVAICLALYLTAKPKWLRLAITFVAIQLAWQAAIETALRVHDARAEAAQVDVTGILQGWLHPGSAGPKPEERQARDIASQESGGFWRYNQNMIMPGLIAGAVGAAGTWLGAALCAAALRTLAAFALAIFTGALAGFFLGFDTLVIFPIWQMAVAASLGFWMPAGGNAAPRAPEG